MDSELLRQHVEARDALQKRLRWLELWQRSREKALDRRIGCLREEIAYLDWQIGEISRSLRRDR